MEGVFKKPKRSIFAMLSLFSGFALMSFGIVGLVKWRPESIDDRFVLWFMSILGALGFIFFVIFYIFPYGKGILKVTEDHIHIDAGLFSKLDCSLGEVSGASADANGMLTVRLRSGKHVGVLCLTNQWELQRYINRILSTKYRFKDKTPVSELMDKVSEKTEQRKKLLRVVFMGIGLMILFLVLCIVLTKGKEISDFTETEKTYFRLFIILEIINFIVTMVFAGKAGRIANEISVLREKMSEITISSGSYPPGIVYKVYASEDMSQRITVMKIPRSEKVYYVLESIQPGGEIVGSEDSPIYPSFEKLLPELDDYTEIQSKNTH